MVFCHIYIFTDPFISQTTRTVEPADDNLFALVKHFWKSCVCTSNKSAAALKKCNFSLRAEQCVKRQGDEKFYQVLCK
jgi:hypothetical protein